MTRATAQVGVLVPALALWAGLLAAPPASAAAGEAPPSSASACVLEVLEVRGADAYLARAAADRDACVPAAGTTLAGPGGAALEVVAVSSKTVLARVVGGRASVGARVSWTPTAAGPGTVPARTFAAGPGAQSPIAPPAFWTEAAAVRTPRPSGPGPGPAQAATAGLSIHGGLGAGVTGVADLSDRDRGFWRAFAESTLRLDRPGAVAIDYRHRIRWQRRFAYDLTAQPWDDDYPQYAVHELSASFGFLDRRVDVRLGRFHPDGVAGAPTVDGAALEGQPVPGLQVGAAGGLLPHPTSLLPGFDGAGFGAWVRGRGAPGAVPVSGSLLVAGSTWKGRLDETHADGMLAVRPARWLDLFLSTRIDAWTGYNPLSRPAVDLTRLLASARARPLDVLEIGLRYAFYRWTTSRRTDDLWGTAFSRYAGAPLNALSLSVRYEPWPGLSLSADGEADIDGPRGPGFLAGGGIAYDFAGGHRIEALYRYNDADTTKSHVAGAAVRVRAHDRLEIEAGYRFAWRTYDGGDRVPEHDATLAVDWRAWRGLFLWASLDWLQGGEVSALATTAQVGWRF